MNGLHPNDIEQRLNLLRAQYKLALQGPTPFIEREREAPRIRRIYSKNGTIVDLGGGISVHNGVLAQLGMSVYVVDLLGEYWERKISGATSIDHEIQVLEASGVKFIREEVSACTLTHFPERSVDVVTSFHCLEHLHQSPKLVLESAMQVLRPGGILLIEVPNAANARKRLALLLGHTNYLPYNCLYYSTDYRGHIREYVTDDLRQLAENLGSSSYRIFGTNAYGGAWMERIPSRLRESFDSVLRTFPGLCGALLLELKKA